MLFIIIAMVKFFKWQLTPPKKWWSEDVVLL